MKLALEGSIFFASKYKLKVFCKIHDNAKSCWCPNSPYWCLPPCLWGHVFWWRLRLNLSHTFVVIVCWNYCFVSTMRFSPFREGICEAILFPDIFVRVPTINEHFIAVLTKDSIPLAWSFNLPLNLLYQRSKSFFSNRTHKLCISFIQKCFTSVAKIVRIKCKNRIRVCWTSRWNALVHFL